MGRGWTRRAFSKGLRSCDRFDAIGRLLYYGCLMCTLVLRRSKGLVAVSAHRHEPLSRPASGPRVEGGVLAPRDETAHGTWLGLNRHGLFVGITNRTGALLDPLRRSRGLLVRDALEATSARALHG